MCLHFISSWLRHQMETFSALLALCAGNSPVNGEFPAQWPVRRSFDASYDLRLNKRLSKQMWGWWFETPSCPLWHHCNATCPLSYMLDGCRWTKSSMWVQKLSLIVNTAAPDDLGLHSLRRQRIISIRISTIDLIQSSDRLSYKLRIHTPASRCRFTD